MPTVGSPDLPFFKAIDMGEMKCLSGADADEQEVASNYPQKMERMCLAHKCAKYESVTT